MKGTLMEATKIGDFLTVGSELEGEEIALMIGSADVSTAIAFKFDEWELFVAAVNKVDKRFKEVKR